MTPKQTGSIAAPVTHLSRSFTVANFDLSIITALTVIFLMSNNTPLSKLQTWVSINSVLKVKYTVRQFFINHILTGKEIRKLNNSDYALHFWRIAHDWIIGQTHDFYIHSLIRLGFG